MSEFEAKTRAEAESDIRLALGAEVVISDCDFPNCIEESVRGKMR
jgi:hypothetical protein